MLFPVIKEKRSKPLPPQKRDSGIESTLVAQAVGKQHPEES
jgi:hypothetical protein